MDEKVRALLEQDVGDLKGKIVSYKRNLKTEECIWCPLTTVVLSARGGAHIRTRALNRGRKRGLIRLGQIKDKNQKSK